MLRLLAICALARLAVAIPVDNGVQGDPEIECGPTSIQVTFNTQNNFEGHVYVKNLYDADGCRTSGDGSRAVGSIELNHFEDSCNVERERSLEPKGVFVRSTLVISFHPNFLTKIDRAYTIQCFYMEADKTVSTDIEVSMITTGFQTQFVPMPICRYEIFDAAEGGNPVQFAIIGQPVFHRWICDTDTTDTFCMRVHSCFVNDGAGNDRLDLIGEDGCATDRYLVGNLEYPSDLSAFKEVHVFKYADRPALQFQCQITITVKEPNGDCATEAQPVCEEPSGGGDGDGQPRRARRATSSEAGTVDTHAHLAALDIDANPVQLPSEHLRPIYLPAPVASADGGICLSQSGFALAAVLAVALVAAVCAIVAMSVVRRQHK